MDTSPGQRLKIFHPPPQILENSEIKTEFNYIKKNSLLEPDIKIINSEKKTNEIDRNINIDEISNRNLALKIEIKSTQNQNNNWRQYLKNTLIFLKCYFLPHAFVAFLTIMIIFLQSLSGKGCFLPPNCLCENNLGLKFRDANKDYFFFYVFLALTCCSTHYFPTVFSRILPLVAIYIFLVGYYILVDEKKLVDLYLYAFCFIIKISLEIFFLRKNDRHFIYRKLFKLNAIFVLFYINYMFYIFILVSMRDYFEDNVKNGRLLGQFVISSYSIFLTYVLMKAHFVYASLVFAKDQNDKLPIFLSSSMMLCYLIGIPASNLLHLKIYNVESYFWLISYLNALSTNFLNWNIIKYVFEKFKYYLCKKFKKNYLEDSKMNKTTDTIIQSPFRKIILNIISESVLDMMFISSFRPLILFLSRKWLAKYGNSKLFKNCDYDYDTNYFPIEPFGIFSTLFMNFFFVGLICCIGMISNRKLLHYRDNFNFLNIYILFLMHVFYEATLTVFR